MTAFEPEALGNLVEGLEFHKFYFDNRKYNLKYRASEFKWARDSPVAKAGQEGSYEGGGHKIQKNALFFTNLKVVLLFLCFYLLNTGLVIGFSPLNPFPHKKTFESFSPSLFYLENSHKTSRCIFP